MAGPTKVPEAGTGGHRKEGANARGRTSQSKSKQHMQLAGDRAVREKSPRDGMSQPQSLEGNSAVNRNGEPGEGSSPKVWFVAGHAASRERLSRTHPAGGCTGPQVGPERGHGLNTTCTEKDLKGTWVVPTHRRGSEGDRQVDRGIEEREDGGSPQNSLHNHQSWDGGCSRNIQRLSRAQSRVSSHGLGLPAMANMSPRCQPYPRVLGTFKGPAEASWIQTETANICFAFTECLVC